MALRDGTYRMSPESGRLLVRTGRSGVGSRAGHDLTIEVARWHGQVSVDTVDPTRSSVTVDAEVESMEVLEGTGGLKPLTDSDRAEIKRNIREKILHTGRHPMITFRSRQVDGGPESIAVVGELTIMGTSRPVTVQGAVSEDGQVRAETTVTQSQWGIKPYSALFGALKLADEVSVEVDARLVPAE